MLRSDRVALFSLGDASSISPAEIKEISTRAGVNFSVSQELGRIIIRVPTRKKNLISTVLDELGYHPK